MPTASASRPGSRRRPRPDRRHRAPCPNRPHTLRRRTPPRTVAHPSWSRPCRASARLHPRRPRPAGHSPVLRRTATARRLPDPTAPARLSAHRGKPPAPARRSARRRKPPAPAPLSVRRRELPLSARPAVHRSAARALVKRAMMARPACIPQTLGRPASARPACPAPRTAAPYRNGAIRCRCALPARRSDRPPVRRLCRRQPSARARGGLRRRPPVPRLPIAAKMIIPIVRRQVVRSVVRSAGSPATTTASRRGRRRGLRREWSRGRNNHHKRYPSGDKVRRHRRRRSGHHKPVSRRWLRRRGSRRRTPGRPPHPLSRRRAVHRGSQPSGISGFVCPGPR